jgi:hypothetical protein
MASGTSPSEYVLSMTGRVDGSRVNADQDLAWSFTYESSSVKKVGDELVEVAQGGGHACRVVEEGVVGNG